MTSRDFCYWLQGYFELENPDSIDAPTAQLIQKHLSMVFIHEIDPSFGPDQKVLQEAHDGLKTKVKRRGGVKPLAKEPADNRDTLHNQPGGHHNGPGCSPVYTC